MLGRHAMAGKGEMDGEAVQSRLECESVAKMRHVIARQPLVGTMCASDYWVNREA